MKCLEITLIPPDRCSGGGMVILQSVSSMLSVCDVDYIGPYFNQEILPASENRFRVLYYLDRRRRDIGSIAALLWKGVSTGYYKAWMDIAPGISWEQYDFVHVEYSRCNFIVHEARKHGRKLLLRMHNIERDYAWNIFIREKNLLNYIRWRSFSYNEKRTVKHADRLIFLTKQDACRAALLYHIKKESASIVPVCLERKSIAGRRKKDGKAIHLLITGTLSYGANADGILWFLTNVWKRLSKDETDNCILEIAGAEPSERLMKTASRCRNVKVAASPDNMEPYFLEADLYIAPVFDGAGMKVKVAEALSYGVPVAGTAHAWIGYDGIISGKYTADTADEFLNLIQGILEKQVELPSAKDVLDEFETYAGISCSCKKYRKIISSVVHKYG